MSIKFEWVDGGRFGWELQINGKAFGRVFMQDSDVKAQAFYSHGVRARTVLVTNNLDEAYDYLLSLARLKCSVI